MNCHEARERFSELLVGNPSLTEWATVESHVSQCAECGQMLDQLYQMAPLNQTRRPGATVRVPRSARTGLRRRPIRLAVVTAVLLALMGFGIYAWHWRHEGWLAHVRSASPGTPGWQRGYDDSLAQPQSAPPTASASTPTASASTPASTEDRRVRAAPPEPAAPTPVTVVVKPESPGVVPSVVKVKRAPRAPAAKAEPAAESVAEAAIPGTDIVVHLSVPDRRAAARDVRTLLARIGGKSRGPESASTMFLVVPRSGYAELTRGLAQIGSWQLESDPGSLPDPVQVAVRLAK
jgi:hypothetical protein